MNKDMIQMANMAVTITKGTDRTVAGELLRVFVDKYVTNEDLTDIFAELVDNTNDVFHVVIDGINPSIRLHKIEAIKSVRETGDYGAIEAKKLVERGAETRCEIFVGNPRDAFHLRDQLRGNGYFAEVF